MGTITQGFRYLGTRAYWPLRWFALEFLGIAVKPNVSAILGSLFGLAVILVVVRFCSSSGLAPSPLAAVLQCGLVAVIAVLMGNLAKELAIDLRAGTMRLYGRNFSRVGAERAGQGADPDARPFARAKNPVGREQHENDARFLTAC